MDRGQPALQALFSGAGDHDDLPGVRGEAREDHVRLDGVYTQGDRLLHDRVRHDIVDMSGKVTWRYLNRPGFRGGSVT